jgi:hypothetical protein
MQWTELNREHMQIPGDQRYMPGTPYFRYESIYNEPQSMLKGEPVHELKEVVEIRFPANPNYKPVFEVTEQCAIDQIGRVITWAERYKDQYQAFLAGAEQRAEGTPLEELKPFGLSEAQLSLCRALSIYSIEQLHQLEGPGVKRLGLHGNDLKPMAKRYMEARRSGEARDNEVADLKRELAELKAASSAPVIPAETVELPDGYEGMTDAQLKDEIAKLNDGKRPQGNPSRATLIGIHRELKAA